MFSCCLQRTRRIFVRPIPFSAKERLLALLLLLGTVSLPGADYTVVITNDNTATGSLRWAIATANTNQATAPHRILFNLPTNTALPIGVVFELAWQAVMWGFIYASVFGRATK